MVRRRLGEYVQDREIHWSEQKKKGEETYSFEPDHVERIESQACDRKVDVLEPRKGWV